VIAEPLLAARGWSVDRGTMTVVRDVDFAIPRGGGLGVLGLNGAGKTTIVEGVMGLLATTGELSYEGAPLGRTSASARARHGMALVPQGRRLIARMTVAENLATASLAPAGEGPELDVHELFPALRELLPRRAGVLSGGQQQQVAIARALLRRPHLLVLDEPTEGLAPSLVAEITEALRALRERGLTILLAEQHHHVIAAVCDEFIGLRAGHASSAQPATARQLAVHGHEL
jgi:ABC-type branched-subunit amino acid transport system ATPase component